MFATGFVPVVGWWHGRQQPATAQQEDFSE